MLNLVREDCEVTVQPVKHLALGWVRCEVADQGAFVLRLSGAFLLALDSPSLPMPP